MSALTLILLLRGINRFLDPGDFRQQLAEYCSPIGRLSIDPELAVTDTYDLLLDLYGADVEYSADSLEDIYKTLSKVGKQVLSEKVSDQEAAAVLANSLRCVCRCNEHDRSGSIPDAKMRWEQKSPISTQEQGTVAKVMGKYSILAFKIYCLGISI